MPANEAIIIELRLAGATAFQAQARSAAGALQGIGGASKKAEKPTSKMAGALGKVAPLAAGAAVGGGLMAAKFGVDSVKAFAESRKVGAQTGAVIKSTGKAAGVSADQVGALAGSISKKTGIDDETIQSGQNMLLTFKNIRNESGKGNDIFNQSTKALVDMSTAMGSDPQQAAIGLGKALNDPVKGISALSRVGVTFSASQEKRIKGLVKEGKTAKAQRIILRELNSEFAGSAKAQATNAARLKVAFGNLQENVGGLLFPTIEKLSALLLKLGPFFSRGGGGARALAAAGKALQPIFGAAADAARQFVWAIRPIIQNAHSLVPVLKVLAVVVGAILFVALKVIRVEFMILGRVIRVYISVIRTAVGAVRSLIRASISAGKAVAQFASRMYSTVRGAVRSVIRTLSNLGSSIRDKVASAFRGAISRARAVISGFTNLGKQIIRAIANGIKSAPGAILDAIKSIIPGGKIGSKVMGALGIGRQHGGTVGAHERVTLVGERGPELATFRPGTRITPLGSSSLPRLPTAGAGPGRGDVVVPVYLNGREIARAIAQDTATQRARRGRG